MYDKWEDEKENNMFVCFFKNQVWDQLTQI